MSKLREQRCRNVSTNQLRFARYPLVSHSHAHTQQVAASTVLCSQCGLVAYCSEACATAALRGWHGGECLGPSSGAPLEADMSGLSPACRVALRALRRVRQEGGPPPNKCESKDGELGRESPVCATANHTRTVTRPDRSGSAPSSPGGCDGCDAAWPTVRLRHLQEHHTGRSTQERELLETEAAIAAVLARGGSGGGAGSPAEGNIEGSKPAGPEACGPLAAELVTSLVKVRISRCRGAWLIETFCSAREQNPTWVRCALQCLKWCIECTRDPGPSELSGLVAISTLWCPRTRFRLGERNTMMFLCTELVRSNRFVVAVVASSSCGICRYRFHTFAVTHHQPLIKERHQTVTHRSARTPSPCLHSAARMPRTSTAFDR